MTSIISKLPQVGTTIFTTMSALATEVGAINLSQGFPDYDCSPELIQLVNQAMKDGYNQYAPMAGVPALREQIAIKTENYTAQNIIRIPKLPLQPAVHRPYLPL